MDWIALLAYLAGTGAVAALFYGVANRKARPVYGEDTPLQSRSLFRLAVLISASVGVLLSVLQSFSAAGLDLLGFATVTLTTMVTFLLVVFAYTDHRHRMADRVLLRWGIGLALVLGILRLIEMQSEPKTVLFVVAILISFAVMFVPSIGASDARAFVLLFAVGIPTLDIIYTYYAFLAGLALWLLYGIVSAIRNRSFKVSIPLVPYILLPLAVAPVMLSLAFGVPRILEVLG